MNINLGMSQERIHRLDASIIDGIVQGCLLSLNKTVRFGFKRIDSRIFVFFTCYLRGLLR